MNSVREKALQEVSQLKREMKLVNAQIDQLTTHRAYLKARIKKAQNRLND